jgi:hypothetical protein
VIVQNISVDEEIEVLGMKSLVKGKKIFKMVADDVFSIDFSDIIAVLPNPKLKPFDGQEAYFFEKEVDINEM